MRRDLPSGRELFLRTHTLRLLRSFRHWTGRDLLVETGSPDELTERLYHHPAVVLSHGAEADPVINYGNEAALQLWETTWERFTTTPSRLTAEAVARDERARLLAEAADKGYLDQYRGVRISTTGRRFEIEGAIVWTVLDEAGRIAGQAATFDRWRYVP
jgi:MEKHLA domain